MKLSKAQKEALQTWFNAEGCLMVQVIGERKKVWKSLEKQGLVGDVTKSASEWAGLTEAGMKARTELQEAVK